MIFSRFFVTIASMQTIDLHVPRINALPATMLPESAIRIELDEGALIFKASEQMNERIEDLLSKEKKGSIDPEERHELDQFEEIDDYLSFVNRLTRNLVLQKKEEGLLVS